MKRLLFVCHGNICRSPMAEFIMKKMVRNAGVDAEFEIESAATSSEELGNPVYPMARQELARHGIGCPGKTARQITVDDYARFDMIIGMDENNLGQLRSVFKSDPDGKISRLLDHTDRPRDIADPWYTRDFRTAWTDISAGCEGLLAELTANG